MWNATRIVTSIQSRKRYLKPSEATDGLKQFLQLPSHQDIFRKTKKKKKKNKEIIQWDTGPRLVSYTHLAKICATYEKGR